MIRQTFYNTADAHRLVSHMVNFGLNHEVLCQIVPRISQYESSDEYYYRLSCIMSPNFIRTAVNLKKNIANSRFRIGGLNEKVAQEIIFECICFGGFYIKENVVYSPIHVMRYDTQWLKNATKLFLNQGEDEFYPPNPFHPVIPLLSNYLQFNSTFYSSLSVAGFPILVRSGQTVSTQQGSKILFNPFGVIDLRSPDADAKWLEHSGRLYERSAERINYLDAILRSECQIDALSALSSTTATNESATTTLIKDNYAIAELDGMMWAIVTMLSDHYDVELIEYGNEKEGNGDAGGIDANGDASGTSVTDGSVRGSDAASRDASRGDGGRSDTSRGGSSTASRNSNTNAALSIPSPIGSRH